MLEIFLFAVFSYCTFKLAIKMIDKSIIMFCILSWFWDYPQRGTQGYRFEPLPGVLGNTGTVAFIFREQGIFSNYFQGTGELLTRLLGSFLGTRGFSNGEQGIKSKKVKGSWEHAPPPGRGSGLGFLWLLLCL